MGGLTERLVRRIAEMLAVEPSAIRADLPFVELGLSSLQAVELSDDLRQWTGVPVPPTLAFDFPTIADAVAHLSGQTNGWAEAPSASAEPVAIIGIGCRVPGASGPDEYWRLLRDGVDAIREVPRDRWDASAMAAKWGGFLDDVSGFDANFFGISTREASRMDPQQRMVLEVAWEALEDAGIAPSRLAGSLTGVFMGVSTYDHATALLTGPYEVEVYDGTGSALSIVANRLSYCLNAHGPSMIVDTACSSSLVAVHLAAQALRNGEATLAVAGGVNVITSPRIAQSFSRGGLMASDGRCKPFDRRADGYVRSEGAGVVVLKPLAAALADGDRVYAVVRGGAVNQDGRTNGLTAPNRPAQEAVLRAAYRAAGVAPADVEYVEAHGTGTAVGDPIEVGALASVLGTGRSRPLRIGSAKSNVGHLEAAAGVAGLIKTALAVYHRAIPPTVHFTEPNPLLGLDEVPVVVPDSLVQWPDPAFAGVSSFGFGGTNCHLVLSAAPAAAPVEREDGPFLFPVSAASADALAARVSALTAAARSADPGWAARAAPSAAVRGEHGRYRAAVVAESSAEFSDALGTVPRGVAARSPRPVFVFPGQGGQWAGMGRQLASVPAFRDAIRRCDKAIARHIGRSLWSDEHGLVPEGTATVQPALFAIQVALAETWMAWGVEPAAVVGHSMGEIAAAHVAGALSLDDAARVVCERSRLLAEISGAGGLALVELGQAEAEKLVASRPDVSVAAVNGPRATVLSGSTSGLDEVIASLDGVFARRIAVEFAAHSPQVEPLQPRLRVALDGLVALDAEVPLYSTVTGAPVSGMELVPAYWERNVREPVLFASALDRLVADGHDVFLEITPHPVLARPIAEAAGDAVTLSSMRREVPEVRAMLEALGALYTAGVPVAWQALFGSRVRHVDLPRRRWDHQDVPLPVRGTRQERRAGSLLGDRIRVGADPSLSLWPLPLDSTTAPELTEHVVEDVPIVPAAYWLAAAVEAARGDVLEDVTFDVPCRLDDPDLQLAVRTGGSFLITSGAGTPVVHASGMIRSAAGEPLAFRVDAATPVSVDEHYERLASAGLRYGERFRGLVELRGGDGVAASRVRLHDSLDDAHRPLHPALLDACLHTVAAATGVNGLALPSGVGRVWASDIACRAGWCHVRVLDAGEHEVVFDAVVVDDAGSVVWSASAFRARLMTPPRPVEAGRLYELEWRPDATGAAGAAGNWLVLASAQDVGDAVAGTLVAAGEQCFVVVDADLDEVLDQAPPLRGVVDARTVGAPFAPDAPPVFEALELVKTLARLPAPPHLWFVVDTGLASAPLWGLGRAVANERPDQGCSVVRMPWPASESDLDSLCGALRAAEPPSQLVIDDGPLAPRLVPCRPDAASTVIQPEREYVITGGLGALGRQVARWLVGRGARHLTLIGRSGASPAAGRELGKLRRQGVDITVARADVARADQLARVLRSVGRPIAGVVHTAGVLEDALAADLFPDALRRVLAGKAAGAWHLHELTRDEPLDLFVLFSSLAGLIGSPGQSGYASANTFLDELAVHRAGRGLPALSVAWGPWADSGLAVSSGGADRLAGRGVPPLDPAVAFALLDEALDSGRPVVAAAAFEPDRLHLAGVGPAAWQLLAPLAVTPEPASFSVVDAVREAGSAAERRRLMRRSLIEWIAEVLRVPAAGLAADVPLRELGFDSLMAIELRDRLESALGVRLSATLVYAHPTADALTDALLERTGLTGPADELSDLDSGELAELLAQELDAH